MAHHPYNLHREHQVSHRRVASILKDEPAGAMKAAKGKPFSKITSKTAAEDHDDIVGSSGPKRYARGGKVKSGSTTNIIIAGGGQKPQPTPVPIPVPAGGPPPGGPPMGPPPGAGGPPGMPPGMPMRARGGRLNGESTSENIAGMAGRAKKNSYAKGGRISAGAMSGEGRLQKAKSARGK